jgi:hypothetical protein
MDDMTINDGITTYNTDADDDRVGFWHPKKTDYL